MAAMAQIAAEPEGGVIVLVRDGDPAGLTRRFRNEPDPAGPEERMLREYGAGAQILRDLGVAAMELLSNRPPQKVVGLEGYGLSIVGWRKLAEGAG